VGKASNSMAKYPTIVVFWRSLHPFASSYFFLNRYCWSVERGEQNESGSALFTQAALGVDSSGNNLNGSILSGGPTYSTDVGVTQIPLTGQVNNFSMNFGGSDAASFAYAFPFDTLSNATLELWLKPNAGDWSSSGELQHRGIRTDSTSIGAVTNFA
jgi:hypothetical protein